MPPDAPKSMSDRAREAVGEQGPDDYHLRPDQHAMALPADAGPLKRILLTPEIEGIMRDYSRYDKEALHHQGRHLRWGKTGVWALVLSFVAAVAMALAPVMMLPSLSVVASVMVWGLLVVAWSYFALLLWKRPQEVWLKARANAEEMRKRLFEAVLAIDEEPFGTEIAPLPLKLEYFRRYQHEVQKAYYDSKSRKAVTRARTEDWWPRLAAALSVLALLLTFSVDVAASSEQGLLSPALNRVGGMLQGLEISYFDTLGTLAAVVLSAWCAHQFAVSQLDDYRRHGQRYANTLRRLDEVANDPRIGFAAARLAANTGDRHTVARLVREMHTLMSADIAEWSTIPLKTKNVVIGPRSIGPVPTFSLEAWPGGTIDLIAEAMLTPADFDRIRTAVGATAVRARRVGLVAARQATAEQEVVTRWNGVESKNKASPGDWIVTNMSLARDVLTDSQGSVNTYVIRADKFPALYDPDSGETKFGAVFKSKSVVDAIRLPGSFRLMAPWGRMQSGASGYLIRNGDEVYGNNLDTFEATYEIIGPV